MFPLPSDLVGLEWTGPIKAGGSNVTFRGDIQASQLPPPLNTSKLTLQTVYTNINIMNPEFDPNEHGSGADIIKRQVTNPAVTDVSVNTHPPTPPKSLH